MNSYRALNQQVFQRGEYSIVPIRFEDRHAIMKWRNEQIYHLRQNKILTEEDQNIYFNTVIANLFDQQQPNQILFSYLKSNRCIGYGGLVHINWTDQHAEISFIMATELEKDYFQLNWTTYLQLIELVAFEKLKLNKIFTYAFNLRPHLYSVLEANGFKREAVLVEHSFYDGKFIDVYIHSKFNRIISLKAAQAADIDITFKWASSNQIRKYSLTNHEINFEEHQGWFLEKIANPKCFYYIASCNNFIVGSIRFDIQEDQTAVISYQLDPDFHGKGFGEPLLKSGLREFVNSHKGYTLLGTVKKENIASIRIFQKLGFEAVMNDNLLIFRKSYED